MESFTCLKLIDLVLPNVCLFGGSKDIPSPADEVDVLSHFGLLQHQQYIYDYFFLGSLTPNMKAEPSDIWTCKGTQEDKERLCIGTKFDSDLEGTPTTLIKFTADGVHKS